MANSKSRYTVTIKFVDNETGKTADLVISADEPKQLGESSKDFIQASSILINIGEAELKEVAEMIQDYVILTNLHKSN